MEFQDPWIEEEKQKNQTEFSITSIGEMTVKGDPNPDIVRQIITSADYRLDQERRYKSEIERQQKQVDIMVVGFLGCTFLLSIFCLFLTINQRTQGESNGQFIRGIGCQQIR